MKVEKKDKKIIYTIIAVASLLTVVFGATYAYFTIQQSSADVKANKVDGSAAEVAKPTLITNIEELKINLDANLMDETKAGTTYYATPSGTPVTTASLGSGRYTLATANVSSGNVVYDCNYTYNVSGSVTKTINDGSDENVKITFKSPSGEEVTYTLKQVLAGVEYEGIISKLKVGTNQTIEVSAYVENTSNKQDDLVGNVFTFKIEMTSGEEGFSCEEGFDLVDISKKHPFASSLVTYQAKVEDLWSSGLEADGLRYIGTGKYSSSVTPDNFICFGTYSKEECTSDVADANGLSGIDKYMYRIIGVFPDENGNQYLKLIKFRQTGKYSWNTDDKTQVNWGESDLYEGLNGEYFLTNSNYSYLQEELWSDRIVDWKWTAVNTMTLEGGPNYYSDISPSNMYLYEMNRSNKTTIIGEWTYPEGKIGLIYASDYVLSIGDVAKNAQGGTNTIYEQLKSSWLHQYNNDVSKSLFDWTIARFGLSGTVYYVWFVNDPGIISSEYSSTELGIRPVFYLTSNTTISAGEGTYTNPYIIG